MSHHTPFSHVKARAVIIKDGRIFLAKHAKAGFFCLPGGTLEAGEKTRDALVREMIEELGVEPKVGPLVYAQELTRETESKFDFWYWIENPEDFENVDLSKATHGFENSEIGFYDPEKTDGLVLPPTLPKLLSIWIKEPRKFIEQIPE